MHLKQQYQKLSFTPAKGLANANLQTVISSVGPRRRALRKRYQGFKQRELQVILNCDRGVRLAGIYNQAGAAKTQRLVTLIHGWEGSADSSYMLSMTSSLLNAGVDVFRLNMRDHGDTQHLNEGLFNSTLIDEVISAVEQIQMTLPYPEHHLGGFSLGGNFALRVAANSHDKNISLKSTFAFCPVMHANSSNSALLQRKNWLYSAYFVRKWKRSLKRKLEHFPNPKLAGALKELRSLDKMNRVLIPMFTQYQNLQDYFDAYAITGDVLKELPCPCYAHFAADDMIIPIQDIDQLATNPDLHITVSDTGGHCGFISDWQWHSWQDARALEIIGQG